MLALAKTGEHDDTAPVASALRALANRAFGQALRAGQMQHQNQRELRELLVRLRAEHRDLDTEIVAMEASGKADQLIVKRLKKRKLALRDRITAIEDQLLPDIIA